MLVCHGWSWTSPCHGFLCFRHRTTAAVVFFFDGRWLFFNQLFKDKKSSSWKRNTDCWSDGAWLLPAVAAKCIPLVERINYSNGISETLAHSKMLCREYFAQHFSRSWWVTKDTSIFHKRHAHRHFNSAILRHCLHVSTGVSWCVLDI